MELSALCYMSSVTHTPTQGEIDALLRRARWRNERESVTGVLLYSEGSFLQYIEGPDAGLERVFAAILKDPLHEHIFELLSEPISERQFARWSMAYRGIGAVNQPPDDELVALLADESTSLTAGRILLNAFWNKGMGGLYQAALGGRRPRPPG